MTIDRAWPFQQAVYQALAAALPGVQGYAFVPPEPPAQYWRIDGWTVSPEQAFKNRERAHHGVTVHLIELDTDSLQWVKQTLATAHAALNGLRLDANSAGLIMQAGDARLEPRADKVNDAHAFMRYTSAIEGT